MKPFNPKLVRLAKLFEPIWLFFGFFLTRKSKQKIENILIFDFHLIGDIVLLTPLLRCIRKSFPNAKICLVAGPWADEILKETELIDSLVEFVAPWVKWVSFRDGILQCFRLVKKLRSFDWDLGIEVRGDIRQILLLVASGAKERIGYDMTGGSSLLTKVIQVDSDLIHYADYHKKICQEFALWNSNDKYSPKLILSAEEIRLAKSYKTYIGIHFGASSAVRQLSIEKAKKIVKEIIAIQNNKNIIIFYIKELPDFSYQLYEFAKNIQSAKVSIWQGTLREFIIKISRCETFYALDSGPAHIAAALDINTKVIYGPSDFRITMPIGTRVEVIDGNKPTCWPCGKNACYSSNFQSCYKDTILS